MVDHIEITIPSENLQPLDKVPHAIHHGQDFNRDIFDLVKRWHGCAPEQLGNRKRSAALA